MYIVIVNIRNGDNINTFIYRHYPILIVCSIGNGFNSFKFNIISIALIDVL